jgi:hypothetical protein
MAKKKGAAEALLDRAAGVVVIESRGLLPCPSSLADAD